MRVGMALCTFILMAGCAAQTGVVPTGQNSYLVAKQAATGFPGLGNLKADALQEANQFCASKGEYKLQLAELDSRLTKERQRRALAVADLEIKRAQAAAETQTAQAAQAQSNAALLLGLAALQSANRPASQPSQLAMPSPPPRMLNTNCQTYGQTTSCQTQ